MVPDINGLSAADNGGYLTSMTSGGAMTLVAQAFKAVADASTQVMTGAARDQIDRSTIATKLQNIANQVEALWSAAQTQTDANGNQVTTVTIPSSVFQTMEQYGIQINNMDANDWLTSNGSTGVVSLSDAKLVQESIQNTSQSYTNATTLNSTTLSNTVSNYTNASQAMSDTFKKWTSLNQGILGNIGR